MEIEWLCIDDSKECPRYAKSSGYLALWCPESNKIEIYVDMIGQWWYELQEILSEKSLTLMMTEILIHEMIHWIIHEDDLKVDREERVLRRISKAMRI